FFFFNDTATTEIYTLSLHDALPISPSPAIAPITDIEVAAARAKNRIVAQMEPARAAIPIKSNGDPASGDRNHAGPLHERLALAEIPIANNKAVASLVNRAVLHHQGAQRRVAAAACAAYHQPVGHRHHAPVGDHDIAGRAAVPR